MKLSGLEEADYTLTTMYVDAWAAIVVDRPGDEPRRMGTCAAEADIPAALRRRLGSYGRMAITCGLGVSTPDSDIVFCSRYGDVGLAHQLLLDLIGKGPMSPAGFSLSVHNAIPGVMDLVQHNNAGHTAIAAGRETLASGFCEALGKVVEDPSAKITLLYTEYILPPVYREFSANGTEGIALALSLSTSRPANPFGRISALPQHEGETEVATPDSEALARLLIEMLRIGGRAGWRSQGASWVFEAGAHASA